MSLLRKYPDIMFTRLNFFCEINFHKEILPGSLFIRKIYWCKGMTRDQPYSTQLNLYPLRLVLKSEALLT